MRVGLDSRRLVHWVEVREGNSVEVMTMVFFEHYWRWHAPLFLGAVAAIVWL